MRPYIRFTDARALTVWQGMAEGMAEGLEDDADRESLDRAAQFNRLLQITGSAAKSPETPYPCNVVIPAELRQAAEDVTENCLDTSSGMEPDDVDADDYIFPGQVTLGETMAAPAPEFTVREAVEEAIHALEKRAMKHDTASPKGFAARAALDTLHALLAQQGCEHMGDGISGLCENCDIAIFG